MDEARSIGELTCAGTDRTLPSTCSPKPIATSRQASAETRRIIGELGTRYKPATNADLDSYSARLRLLASDLRDENPAHLATAAEQWAKSSPFLPKACELIDVCRALADVERYSRPLRHTALAAPVEAEAPELTDDELQALPPGIVRLGLKAGHIDPERATRLGLATSELLNAA